MSPNKYCDDKITPNEHDELILFLGCEKVLRKTSLVDMSVSDMNRVLLDCHLYCVKNCHANTYIQKIIKMILCQGTTGLICVFTLLMKGRNPPKFLLLFL